MIALKKHNINVIKRHVSAGNVNPTLSGKWRSFLMQSIEVNSEEVNEENFKSVIRVCAPQTTIVSPGTVLLTAIMMYGTPYTVSTFSFGIFKRN